MTGCLQSREGHPDKDRQKQQTSSKIPECLTHLKPGLSSVTADSVSVRYSQSLSIRGGIPGLSLEFRATANEDVKKAVTAQPPPRERPSACGPVGVGLSDVIWDLGGAVAYLAPTMA